MRRHGKAIVLAGLARLALEGSGQAQVHYDPAGGSPWNQRAAFGATKQATPNLDRMAAEGMKLTSFFAAPV